MAETTWSRENIIKEIQKRIQEDPLAVDLQISLFVSALQSYRFDTVLKPFPPIYLNSQNEKNKSELLNDVSQIPRITNLRSELSNLSDNIVNLIWWIIDTKKFKLKSTNKDSFDSIQKLTGNQTSVPSPSFIYELQPSETSEVKFQEKRQDRKLFYAYHGSRTENFHSIMHHGLVSHMNKTSVFGEGTYLSGELSVSLNYSPSGLTWSKSQLGNMIGCVAVGEIIDDPRVKCQVKDADGTKNKSRASAKNSMAGDVPERYYIVQNNEVIRVKYLLIYVDKTSHQLITRQPSFFQQHKFLLMLMFYVVLLVAIGSANSRTFKYYLKRFYKEVLHVS